MSGENDSDLPLNTVTRRSDLKAPSRFRFRARYLLILLVPGVHVFRGCHRDVFPAASLAEVLCLDGVETGWWISLAHRVAA